VTLLFVNNGEEQALRYIVNKDGLTENLLYKLFTNNITPAETDTAGSYTEASGGGYADIELTGSSWVITPGAPAQAAYAQQEWTFSGALSGGASLYGYYALRAVTLDLMFAERFATARTPANVDDKLRLTPKVTAD
jgi:hypothetical protein